MLSYSWYSNLHSDAISDFLSYQCSSDACSPYMLYTLVVFQTTKHTKVQPHKKKGPGNCLYGILHVQTTKRQTTLLA